MANLLAASIELVVVTAWRRRVCSMLYGKHITMRVAPRGTRCRDGWPRRSRPQALLTNKYSIRRHTPESQTNTMEVRLPASAPPRTRRARDTPPESPVSRTASTRHRTLHHARPDHNTAHSTPLHCKTPIIQAGLASGQGGGMPQARRPLRVRACGGATAAGYDAAAGAGAAHQKKSLLEAITTRNHREETNFSHGVSHREVSHSGPRTHTHTPHTTAGGPGTTDEARGPERSIIKNFQRI